MGLGFRVQDVCIYIYIERERGFRVTCKVYTGVHKDVEGVGFRDITPIMENQMKKNMKNDMETVIIWGWLPGLGISSTVVVGLIKTNKKVRFEAKL